jgi:hypothetical protein
LSYRTTICALVCTLLAWSSSHAEESHKNEVGLLLGGTVTPALSLAGQSGSGVDVGTGLTFQATYARELLGGQRAALHFEVPFVALPLQDVSAPNGVVPANYASLFITPGLRLKLAPRAAISPWFAAGGGYARFDESAERVDGTPNTARTGTNRGAVQFGAGVDLRTPVKILFPIGLRIEVRDFYSGKPNYNANTGGGFQHNVVFSGGIILHF